MRRRRFGTIRHRPDRDAWFVQFTFQGRQIQRRAGRTEAEALRKLEAVRTALEDGRRLPAILNEVFGDVTGHRLTFRAAAPMYLQYAEPRKKASTFEGDVSRLRVLSRASWAGKFLGQITTQDLTRWAASRMTGANAVSGATVNRDLDLTSALFKWATKMGFVETNPVRAVERASEKGRGRKSWLTVQECSAVAGAASPHFRPMFLCFLHAGLRLGEVTSLVWGSVDFERREIVVEPEKAKSGEARHVPLTTLLAGELEKLRPTGCDPGTHVFRDPQGKPWTEDAVRYWLRHALARCPEIPSARRKQITPHVLRHTFTSHLAQQGVPFHEIAALLGHSSTYVTARYAHLAPEAGKGAINLLEKRLGPASTGGQRDGVGELVIPFGVGGRRQIVPTACPDAGSRAAS